MSNHSPPAPKSVLITGCSAGGIGASLALAFQKRNYLVFATARNTTKIPVSLTSLPNVVPLQLDVVSPASIAVAVKAVKAQVGDRGLDVLVNNSGLGMTAPALDSDIEQGKALFDVNFWGVLRVTQAFADLLIKAKGVLVNISSIAGEAYDTYQSIYNASKAALTMASETWRLELQPLGVRVVVVVTGNIKSNFFNQDFKLPEGSHYRPIENIIKEKSEGRMNSGETEPDVFADLVVTDVENGATGRIYRGQMAGLVRIARAWAPTWLTDKLLLNRGSGVKELRQAIESS